MEIWVIKKRSRIDSLRFYISWKWLQFKHYLSRAYDDLKTFVANDELCYYNYNTKKVFFISGRTMLRKRVRRTFGEVVYIAQKVDYRGMDYGEVVHLLIDNEVNFCERF